MNGKNPDNGAFGRDREELVVNEHPDDAAPFVSGTEPRSTPDPHDSPTRERGENAPRLTQVADETRSSGLRSTPDPHAHALAHEEASEIQRPGLFPHEKLDAYRVALEMAALSKKLAKDIPRGHRSIADHMLRAASNTVLLLAEGANRRSEAEKRQRFVESRGECAEVAAAGDLLLVLDIGSPADAETLKRLAGRVSAMLTRLIGRLR